MANTDVIFDFKRLRDEVFALVNRRILFLKTRQDELIYSFKNMEKRLSEIEKKLSDITKLESKLSQLEIRFDNTIKPMEQMTSGIKKLEEIENVLEQRLKKTENSRESTILEKLIPAFKKRDDQQIKRKDTEFISKIESSGNDAATIGRLIKDYICLAMGLSKGLTFSELIDEISHSDVIPPDLKKQLVEFYRKIISVEYGNTKPDFPQDMTKWAVEVVKIIEDELILKSKQELNKK